MITDLTKNLALNQIIILYGKYLT